MSPPGQEGAPARTEPGLPNISAVRTDDTEFISRPGQKHSLTYDVEASKLERRVVGALAVDGPASDG